MPGSDASVAEVTCVSKHGFWLLLNTEELLVPFALFPWFCQATIAQIVDVQWPSQDHLFWPQLDVDLSVQSIRMPESFPLMANSAVDGR